MSLRGNRVLVTGAAGGLGSAIAIGFAREGATLALHDHPGARGLDTVRGAVAGAGAGGVTTVTADLEDSASVAPMVGAAAADLGGLDVLVNCAGVMPLVPVLEIDEETWDLTLDVNLKAAFLASQAAAKIMSSAGGGRIINVTSTRQEQAAPGNAAYCASKAGLLMLTRVMALELASRGIRVNAVAPGTIETPLNKERLADPVARAERLKQIPVGRLGEPKDVVGAILLLARPESDFVTGASLMIDGGQTIS